MTSLPRQHPDVYDRLGLTYTATRRPDPQIEAQLRAELTGCSTLVNVGAGTGSYEAVAPSVTAVEPSREMLARRAPDAAPAVRAAAEALPFADASFDAALAVLTVHHWCDWRCGVREMIRVARRRILILTHMHEEAADHFWLLDLFPEIPERDRGRMPTRRQWLELVPDARIEVVPVARNCADGFLCAFWARPRAYLDATVRAGISAFDGLDDVEARLAPLASELESGAWGRRHGALSERASMDFGYRLIIAEMD